MMAVGADWLIRPANPGIYAFKQPKNRHGVNHSKLGVNSLDHRLVAFLLLAKT